MGCRVQAAEPVPAAEVPLRFILPGTAHLIEGSGEVMWADDGGRARILFRDLRAAAEGVGWRSGSRRGDRRDRQNRGRERPVASTEERESFLRSFVTLPLHHFL
jgi:hypothetical protein